MRIYLLTVTPLVGGLSLLLLFAACFCIVHGARLLLFGVRYQRRTPERMPPPEREKSPPESKSEEPIYYIVERKRKVKSTYAEPKRIRFK